MYRARPKLRRGRATTGLIALLALVACSDAKQPNVLLITLDTTRADYFGSYGYTHETTPRMDAIASDGVLFEAAQSSSSTTPISHASILTGLNPYRHGLRVISAASGFRLGEDVPTLATLLEAEGYYTAAVHSAFPVSAAFGFQEGFRHFDEVGGKMSREKDKNATSWDVIRHQRRSDATSRRVIRLLDDLPEPFFLWIHYWDPHDVFRRPPEEFRRKAIPVRPGAAPFPHAEDWYAKEIRYMDREIGRVVDYLDAIGRWDETITLITSDHGQGLADGERLHGWRGHRLVYREHLHVPLILRGPGVVAGRRVSDLVRTIDILPTLLDLVGTSIPVGLDGASLRPLLEGSADPHAPRIAYADQINGYDWNGKGVKTIESADFLYSVSDGIWKLIYRPSRPHLSELFNVVEDPQEQQDLYAEYPDEALRLMRDLARREPWVDQPFPNEGDPLSATGRAALASRGYSEDSAAATAEGPQWGWRCPEGGPIHDAPAACDGSSSRMVLVARDGNAEPARN